MGTGLHQSRVTLFPSMFSVVPADTGPLGVGCGEDVTCVGLDETDWLAENIVTVPTVATVPDAPDVPRVVEFGDAALAV